MHNFSGDDLPEPSSNHLPQLSDVVPSANASVASAASSTLDLIQAVFTDDCVFHPTTDNYVMIVSFCIIFCLSVVGNSVVVVVILQNRSMRSVTNLYLLNLALSDLLLSVVCMPPTLVSSLVYCWVFGDLLCKLLAYLQPVVVTASAYTLAAIALERYYAICRPLHSRVWHTKKHAMLVIALVWLISVIANMFMLFMYEERTYNRNGLNCAPKYEPVVHLGYQIYMTVVLLVIPLVTMTILYGSVIRSLRMGIRMDIAAIELQNSAKSNNNGEGSPKRECYTTASSHCHQRVANGNSAHSATMRDKKTKKTSVLWSTRSERQTSANAAQHKMDIEQSLRSTHSGRTALAKQRLIRMLIVIVIIFFCCWTPSYIWWLLLNAQDSFGTINVWNSELNTLITVLTYLSSCTNPITYCFLNSKFRHALFLTFGCNRRNAHRTHFQRVYAPILAASLNGGTPRVEEGAGNLMSNLARTIRGNSPRGTTAPGKAKPKGPLHCCLEAFSRKKHALFTSTPLTTKNGNGRNHDTTERTLRFQFQQTSLNGRGKDNELDALNPIPKVEVSE